MFGNIFPSFVERRAGHSLVGKFNRIGGNRLFKKILGCLYAIGGLNFYDETAPRGWGFTDTTEKLCFTYWTIHL